LPSAAILKDTSFFWDPHHKLLIPSLYAWCFVGLETVDPWDFVKTALN